MPSKYDDDVTPVPEDDATLQKYISDRRVIGVSLFLQSTFLQFFCVRCPRHATFASRKLAYFCVEEYDTECQSICMRCLMQIPSPGSRPRMRVNLVDAIVLHTRFLLRLHLFPPATIFVGSMFMQSP